MKKGSFHYAAQFGSWFLKKKKNHKVHVSSPWYIASTKSLNEAHKIFSALINYTFMWTSDFYWYEHVAIYLQKQAGVSKHSWKKITQLLWTVVTYLLKNVKHGIEHDIDSTYGNIRHSWNSQEIWWILCNLSRW